MYKTIVYRPTIVGSPTSYVVQHASRKVGYVRQRPAEDKHTEEQREADGHKFGDLLFIWAAVNPYGR